jgi:hypothetical protein
VQVIALDIDREAYEIGAPLIVKAGVAHKVDFRDGPAMDGIDMLLKYVSWSFPSPSLHLLVLPFLRVETL